MSKVGGEHFVTVEMQNVGPIAEGTFQVKPLTLFTGRNSVGKTITSTLLYILQKSLWNSLRSRQRTLSARLVNIARESEKKDASVFIQRELNAFIGSAAFRKDLQNGFTEELARAFSLQKNIIRHGKRKAYFRATHSIGWKFECELSANTAICHFESGQLALEQDTAKTSNLSMSIQRGLSTSFQAAFVGWQDRPIMIPAGRAGITDSYRYLAEQILLERHGYRQGGPSGITRDFLALLVGSTQPDLFLDEEAVAFVSSLFDPLLGGELRPSSSPEELFTFDVRGHRIDRNVMSSMVKELGPMVVLLQQSTVAGSVLIVDEPECHLHPRAQVGLARAIVALVARDARFILSTHSPYLAQSLSNTWVEQARAGRVGSHDMSVVNFSPSPKGVIVENVPFDSKFGFTFEDFAQTANDVQDEFVELFD